MSQITEKTLSRVLYKVLRPMVRLLLRHGVSFKSFSDIARHVFVDVAEQDFALPGRKASNSRTAVLTGVNRKDIAKLKDRPHPLSDEGVEAPNPAARVINAWLSHPSYSDVQGKPLTLSIESIDGEPSLTALAREYSSDVPVRALLDELGRLNAIENDGTKVQLKVKGYVPLEDMHESLRIFGTAASDLLSTMDHNIGQLPPEPYLQKTVSYHNIPPEKLAMIRERCRLEGEALLLQVNDWLAECDEPQIVGAVSAESFRAGVGIYYFEHSSSDKKEM